MVFPKGTLVQIKMSKILGTVIGMATFKNAEHYGVAWSENKARVIMVKNGKFQLYTKYFDIKWCKADELEIPTGEGIK